jgi:predicted nucleotidyltransferase
MNEMKVEYDLAALAEDLARTIPEISELYLFGSRAHGTKSIRSDVDVLVVSDGHVKPQQLRDFSSRNCEALDLFIVDGSRAVSSQNESFIEADSFQNLLMVLSAIKIWSRNEGRAQAGIEWRFKIRDDVKYPATALPNTTVVKAASRAHPLDPSRLTVGEIFSSMTAGQLWAVGSALGGVLVVLLGFAFWLGTQLIPGTPPAP